MRVCVWRVQFRIPSAFTNSEYAVGVVGTAMSIVGTSPDRDIVVDSTDWLHNYTEAVHNRQQGASYAARACGRCWAT